MLTEILAIYAAAVATCSLAISYFTYQSGGPRLSGQALLTGRFSDAEGPMLDIAVYNRGRGPVTIDRIFLWILAPVKAGPASMWTLKAPDVTLPARIEGHSGANWLFPVQETVDDLLDKRDLAKLKVWVSLANGKTLTLKIDTILFDSANPNWRSSGFTRPPTTDETTTDDDRRQTTVVMCRVSLDLFVPGDGCRWP